MSGARAHAVALGVLVTAVATGTVAFRASSSSIQREIPLTPGHTTSLTVFRLFPEVLRMELVFRRDPRRKAPEKTPLAWHPNPGAPVSVRARVGNGERVYAAHPPSGFSYDSMQRDLWPIPDEGDPRRIPWPPRRELALVLPSGSSQVDLVVAHVDPALEGEAVLVVIVPPVGLKETSSHPGYQLLWWFHLWPVLLGAVALYGVGAAWSLRRKQRQAAASPRP